MTGEPATRNEIADLVGAAWTEEKVLSTLGLTAETVTSWRAAGVILGLPTSDGVLVYPVSQFHRREDRFAVRRELLPLFRALRGFDPWAVAVLLHTPTPELDGATPLGWLSSGGTPEAVSTLGKAVAREWAAGTPPD